MNVEKLPSGKYRVRQMVNGRMYRITFDHKPTQAEIIKSVSQKVEKNTVSVDMPFKRACDLYIESKENVLSVSSIRGYRGIMRQISPSFMMMKLSAITLPSVQTEINAYGVDHSPKSVKNMSGFIMAVLKYYGVQIQSPKVPQKERKSPYIPTKEEVSAVFRELKGSKFELPIMLAAMGLRRSEICALRKEDLNGNVLTIQRALVQDEHNNWVLKSTKTTESTRTIVLPDYIVSLINERGMYEGHPNHILRQLNRVTKRLGIEHFTPHKLRHFFASYLHDLGYSDKQIQEVGGWKTDNVMKTVYTHAMEMDKAKAEMASSMNALI
jgi:integrase